MATLYTLHPQTPQARRVSAIGAALRDGAVALYPTDTVYAIGCDLNHKRAVERVRQLKQLANDKPLTFLCSSLSNIAAYATVSDSAYRVIRRLIPGPFTFILPATKQVPRLVMNPKRRTTGIRVPDHPISHALIDTLQGPIISTSALTVLQSTTDDADLAYPSKALLFDALASRVDVIIDDDQPLAVELSTIVDLTEDEPYLQRRGLGWEAAAAWVGEPV